jgi:hypothetical protein
MSGAISWLPLQKDIGFDTVRVRATDGVLSDTATFILHIKGVNDAPVIVSTFPDTLKKDSLYIIPLSAFDEEMDILTWSIPDMPAGMQIIDTTIVWVPNSTQVVRRPV